MEIKIPYQSLRFPKTELQKWGVNFQRNIKRNREIAYWNSVDPNILGIINQSGDLIGIKNIVSPLRLTLLPYISGYAENYNKQNANSLNGGLDLKYGINESFTLDMTLIPDFGQTLSDNVVLNLSPVEVKFDERRYFLPRELRCLQRMIFLFSSNRGRTFRVRFSRKPACSERRTFIKSFCYSFIQRN